MPDRIGKYEIRGTLGRGAMGTVLDGWDPAIERRVAIKTVRLADAAADEEAAEALERFKREAQAAGRLSHANIVGVFDTGETEDLAYIVMEFIEGRSLKQVLDSEKSLPPDEAAEIMMQVLSGLDYSHRRGVVHRDIKPANIMLTTDGGVKIADFGIARLASSTATAVGSILGTPAYMPPEQFLGEPADARSDIFAAGATLFHVLTGSRPHEGNASFIMARVLNDDAPPRPSARSVGVSPAWDGVLLRAMAKRPEDRYQSAAAFSLAVKTALSAPAEAEADADATVIVATPRREAAQTPLPPKSGGGRKLPLLGGMALGVLFLGGGAWFLLSPRAKPPPPALPEPRMASPAPAVIEKLQPALPAPPPPSPEAVRSTLAASLASLPCSFVEADIEQGVLKLRGIAGGGAPEQEIGRATASLPVPVAVEIDPFSGPYCPALDVLAPVLRQGRLQFTATEKPGAISSAEFFHPVIRNLPFAAWVQVDYFTGDGTVFHAMPMAGNSAKGLVAEPARLLPKGAELRLGGKGHTQFTPDKPFGKDLFIAVASSQKLFPGLRPQFEKATDYVQALRIAVERVRAGGGDVAAGFVLVRTVEK